MKTIKDVLEKWPDGWPFSLCEYKYCGYSLVTNDFFVYPDGFEFIEGHGYFICTREQYEQARREKVEEQEWTHVTEKGYKCKVALSEPDSYGSVIILSEHNVYIRCYPEDINPIKQKLTKAQAWDYAVEHDVSPTYVASEFDITD